MAPRRRGAKPKLGTEEFIPAGGPSEDELVAAIKAAEDQAAVVPGTYFMVYGKDGSAQFFPVNLETDVIAFGKQDELTQVSLASVEQVELGVIG